MQLTCLEVERAGPFARAHRLDRIQPGLNLLVAPNERGKSTMLWALQTVLDFGHGTSSKDCLNRFHDRSGRIRLQLTWSQGQGGEAMELEKCYGQGRSCKLRLGGTEWGGPDAETRLKALLEERAGAALRTLTWMVQGENLAQLSPDVPTLRGIIGRTLSGPQANQIRRLQDLIAAEKADLRTAKQQKPTGKLRSAMLEETTAAQRCTEARQALQLMEQQLLERDRLQAELADPEPARIQGELRVRQEAIIRLLEQHSALREARNAEAETRTRCEQLQDRLARLRQDAESEARLSGGQAAAATVEALAQAVDEAQRALSAAKAEVARLDRVAALTRLQERQQQLSRDLQQVAALTAQIADAEKALAAIPTLDPVMLRTLADLHLKAERAEAEAAASEVQVLITAKRPLAPPRLMLDDRAIAPGSHRIRGAGALQVGEDITLQITTPGGVTARAKLEAAAQALAEALARAGVPDLEAARAAQEARGLKESELQSLRTQRGLLRPDGELTAEQARLARDATQLDLPHAEAAAQALAAEQARPLPTAEAARAAVSAGEAALREAERAKAAQRGRLDAEAAERASLAARRPAEGWADAIATTEAEAAGLTQTLQFRAQAVLTLASALAGLPEAPALQAEQSRIQLQAQQMEMARRQAEQRLGITQALLDSQGDSDPAAAVAAAEVALADAQAKVKALEERWTALDHLDQCLTRSMESWQAEVLQPLTDRLEPRVRALFGQQDGSLQLDPDLKPQRLLRGGQAVPVDALSGGCREQIQLLTRFAYAAELAEKGRPLPLILDDAMAFADDGRLERLQEQLLELSRSVQILVFTCHQRAWDGIAGHRLRIEAA